MARTLFLFLTLGISSSLNAQWTHCGLPDHYITSFAVFGTDLVAGVGCNAYDTTQNTGIFRSGDMGTTWSQSNMGLTDTNVSALLTADEYLYAGTSSGVFRSGDGGKSWHALPGMQGKSVASFTAVKAALFAATTEGIYRSLDAGDTWQAVNTGLTQSNFRWFGVIGNTLYANNFGDIFRTTDLGDHWSDIERGAIAIGALGNKLFNATFHSGDYGLDFTTDDGKTWIEEGSGGCGVYDGFYPVGSIIFCIHSQNGDSYSIDSGATWVQDQFYDLNNVIGLGSYLFAGTYEGIWKRPLSEFGITAPVGPPPPTGASSGVELSLQDQTAVEVCPNPVVDVATLQSVGPAIESVSIVNLLGEEVLDFKHPLFSRFDLSHLPAGTYFMKIATTDGIRVRKIVKQ